MGRYVIRRLLQLIPVFFGTTFIIYVLVWKVPGDPFAAKCGERPCPQSYIDVMTEKFNLNDPVIVQYGKYLWNLLHGDFGTNFAGQSVADQLLRTYPTTVKLAVFALIIEALIGIFAGVVTGLRRGGYLDNLVLVSTLLLISLPVFVTGYIMRDLIGPHVLPLLGIKVGSVSTGAPLPELLFPALVLGSLSMAYIARLTRSSVAENRRADYVRTAIAKGLPGRRVAGIHLLRNSLIPVVTFLGTDLGVLMGGAIVTEGIFNIDGVGNLVFRSIVLKQGATVVGVVTVLVLVYLVMNLLVDLI
ncbi:MAG: ABC transporter permease [Kineosporiaceae bacterium]